jgi:outer membrane protein TolC
MFESTRSGPPRRPARSPWVLLLLLAGPAAAQQPRTVTLEEAIRLAVQRDPAAVAAEAAADNARSDRLVARGAFLPTFNFNTAFANSSNERFDQNTGRLVSESYTAQAQGSYELFAFGRKLAQLRSTGADVAAADAEYDSQRFATVLRTTELFYSAAAGANLARVADQRLARARQQLAAAQTRLELGTVTQSDVLRAELEVGNAEVAVLDAQSALRTSALELGRQIGLSEAVHTTEAALPERAPQLPETAVLLAAAERGSPGVVAAEMSLRSRHAERLAAYTPYLPTVRVTGGYDWFAFDWPPSQQSWSLRLVASLPVFNGFQREAALQRAAAAERVAEARARDARNQARVAVESAVAEIASAEQRVRIADRAVTLAREDLRVIEERYAIAAATILEVQTSQLALSDAEVAAVRARQALGTSLAQLESILGRQLNEG